MTKIHPKENRGVFLRLALSVSSYRDAFRAPVWKTHYKEKTGEIIWKKLLTSRGNKKLFDTL